ncbi:MAG TPA: hypothetical protein VLS48_00815 [Anaerolineales bacterium]|nr:hypothetical protein [Anaerolineales bacterium]
MNDLNLQLPRIARVLEWAFALLGGLSGLSIILGFLVNAGATQSLGSLFPFPLLYLIELFFAVLMGAMSVFLNKGTRTTLLAALPWITAGILLAFVALGSAAFGPGLVLPMLAFLIAGVLTDLRQGGSLLAHAGLLLLVAVIQAFLMFVNLIVLA